MTAPSVCSAGVLSTVATNVHCVLLQQDAKHTKRDTGLSAWKPTPPSRADSTPSGAMHLGLPCAALLVLRCPLAAHYGQSSARSRRGPVLAAAVQGAGDAAQGCGDDVGIDADAPTDLTIDRTLDVCRSNSIVA